MNVHLRRRVLNVDVGDEQWARWRAWFAPEVQPFRVDRLHPRLATLVPPTRFVVPSDEVYDTFGLDHGVWAWFDEDEFDALHADARRALLTERRRAQDRTEPPPWPSVPAAELDERLAAWVSEGVRPSQHAAVAPEVWRRAAARLPGARALAGTFARRSGPNGFATVLGAAGLDGAAEQEMQAEPFAWWLEQHTRPVRGTARDTEPGVVLVWTDRGALADAAVTIGGGWALHKPSSAWFRPRAVWRVTDVVAAGRTPGSRLRRYWITG